jgi:hypothetical protein
MDFQEGTPKWTWQPMRIYMLIKRLGLEQIVVGGKSDLAALEITSNPSFDSISPILLYAKMK